MWEHQGAFQSAVDVAARDALSALDQALEARALLVGFRRDGSTASPPICIEPEDAGINGSVFSAVPELAAALAQRDPERNAFAADARSRQLLGDRIFRRAWQRAVEQALAREEDAPGWRSFASSPADIKGYRVVCVLQLARKAVDSYYSLTRETLDEHGHLSTSLLDALVGALLTGCGKALGLPDPGSSARVIDRTASELHRNAGRGLMQTVAWACRSYEAVHTLYDAICELSAARYEGESKKGRMLIAAQDHPIVESLVQFDNPVSLTSTKAARKIFEVVTPDLLALSEGTKIHGLGRLRGPYDERREDLFLVDLVSHHVWQLSHAGHILMRVQYGQPSLPVQPVDEGKLSSTISRLFKDIEKEDVARLRTQVLAATRQRHGTLLVISDHAAEEAKRLAAQSTLVRPVELTGAAVEALSAIDGALLLDPRGKCHAIGVILDGLASEKGTSARGARFNSAVRYVETATRQFSHRCMAVVVSEDGPIDIIPELVPQIRRSLITDTIKAFARLRETYPISRQDFNRYVRWFQAYKTYLWPEAAKEINQIRRELEMNLEPSNVSIVWRKIEGNPDLDSSYFLEG
jgi:hypothetical protein